MRLGIRHWARPALLAVGLLAAAVVLAACDEDEPADGGTPTVAAGVDEETATPVATPTAAATTPAAAGATGTPAAGTESTVGVSNEGELAPYLVGPDGMTLYIFTRDERRRSNCTEQCLANWPPLTVEEGEEPTAGEGVTGELGVIERADGTRQVTYNEMPLYYYAGDQTPGDTNGQGVGDVWFVAEPEPDGSASQTSPGDGDGDGVDYNY